MNGILSHWYSISNINSCKRSAAFVLGIHCLPMSHLCVMPIYIRVNTSHRGGGGRDYAQIGLKKQAVQRFINSFISIILMFSVNCLVSLFDRL